MSNKKSWPLLYASGKKKERLGVFGYIFEMIITLPKKKPWDAGESSENGSQTIVHATTSSSEIFV